MSEEATSQRRATGTGGRKALTDPEKQRHLALLWQLERGIQPPPGDDRAGQPADRR